MKSFFYLIITNLMTFECSVCGKNLPSRTGIWNHLKTKHTDKFEEKKDVDGKKQR
jgi:hypothetical protein